MGKKVQLPRAEAVRRCQNCGRVMTKPSEAIAQNPFCVKCLPERQAEASKLFGTVSWTRVGDYLSPNWRP